MQLCTIFILWYEWLNAKPLPWLSELFNPGRFIWHFKTRNRGADTYTLDDVWRCMGSEGVAISPLRSTDIWGGGIPAELVLGRGSWSLLVLALPFWGRTTAVTGCVGGEGDRLISPAAPACRFWGDETGLIWGLDLTIWVCVGELVRSCCSGVGELVGLVSLIAGGESGGVADRRYDWSLRGELGGVIARIADGITGDPALPTGLLAPAAVIDTALLDLPDILDLDLMVTGDLEWRTSCRDSLLCWPTEGEADWVPDSPLTSTTIGGTAEDGFIILCFDLGIWELPGPTEQEFKSFI